MAHPHTSRTTGVYCQGKVEQTAQVSIMCDPSKCPHSVFSSFPCFSPYLNCTRPLCLQRNKESRADNL